MEYYYLDPDRQSHGPHSLEELSAMLTSGTLSPETLVAKKGDERWQPLGVVLSQQTPAMPGDAPASKTVCCPKCRNELSLSDGKLPEKCPSCGYIFRPAKGGFWAYALLPLRKYCSFKGRATRRELWFFYLFSVLLSFALCFLIGVFSAVGVCVLDEPAPVFVLASVLFPLAVFCLSIGLLLPNLAVGVRRLHDVGFSGKWMLLILALNCIYGGLMCYISFRAEMRMPSCPLVSFVEEPSQENVAASAAEGTNGQDVSETLTEDAYSQENAERSSEMETAVTESNAAPSSDCSATPTCFDLLSSDNMHREASWVAILVSLAITYILLVILSIGFLVISFLDSQKGSNKYGPSPKYPLS